MIDLSKYRIVDLTYELVPGERKIDGHYLHGDPMGGRPIEVQEFIAYGARMHFFQAQTHLGTHVEATYKYDESGPDLGAMPVASYLGEAIVCDFSHKREAEPITPQELSQAGVKSGDIVLAWASEATRNNRPYLTNEAVDWMIQIGIKMLGIQALLYSPPGTPTGMGDSDCRLLLAGIPMIDSIRGLDEIRKKRVFFIALPLKIRRITAFSTRAIVLEELD